MKNLLAALAAGLVFAAGMAIAATVSFVGSPYIKLPTGVESYQKSAVTSSFTVSFVSGQSEMVLTNSGLVSGGTINFYAHPYDGQMSCIYSQGGVAATVTLSAASPQVINNTVTALSAATRYCWIFSASNSTWDRVQ